jgi:hypothetical protein
MAGATGSLLTPGLLAASANFTAILRVRDWRSGIRLHTDDNLMDEIAVPRRAEDFGGKIERSGLLAIKRVHCGGEIFAFVFRCSHKPMKQ